MMQAAAEARNRVRSHPHLQIYGRPLTILEEVRPDLPAPAASRHIAKVKIEATVWTYSALLNANSIELDLQDVLI